MVKRSDAPKVSPFDALKIARLSKVAPDSQPVKQLDSQTVTQLTGLAKSRDPRYVKFTTYVPRQTHLRVKSLLVGEGRELSDLVSELLEDWLSRQLTV